MSLRRALKLLRPRGTASCWELSHNKLPGLERLIPDGKKWSRYQRDQVVQLFPAMTIKDAFKRCRRGALPVEAGFYVAPDERTNEFVISQARKKATGTVKLLLEAIEVAHPEVLADGKTLNYVKRPAVAMVEELNKIWKPLNRAMTNRIMLGVMGAVKSCAAGMQFFQWSREHADFEPDTVTYNGLVEMVVKRGFIDQGFQLYKLMQKPHLVSAGCGPNGETVAILVRELCTKEFEKAVAVLNYALFENQLEVGDDVLHEVIESLCQMSGQLPLSLRYFHRMKNPSDKTYQLLVRTMSKEQFLYEAYDLIVSMEVGKGFPTDDVTYHLLISEFCRRKEVSYAHVLLYDFMDRGRIPSVITFNTVLQLLCGKGDRGAADKAWNLFLSMRKTNVKLNTMTYSILLQILSNTNRIDQALILLDEMLRNDCTPGSVTGSTIVSALARADRVDEALDLCVRMQKEFQSPVEREAATNTVYGFLRLKPLKQSLRALRELQSIHYAPDLTVYNVVISMLCKKNHIKPAMVYFNKISARTIPDRDTYEPLIGVFCRADKLPAAYKLFQDMVQKGCEPNLNIYKMIITSFTKAGNMDDACKLLEYMFNKDVYPDRELYQTIIDGLQKTGNAQACDILRSAVKQTEGDIPNEVMFKAVFRLRSCVRALPKEAAPPKAGDSTKLDPEAELAELVDELPVAPVSKRVKDDSIGPGNFSQSESESEAEEETITVQDCT